MWWRCTQYFVIASCGKNPRENKCVYMMRVCFMSDSECVDVCKNTCFSGSVLKYGVYLCMCM